MRKYLIIAMLTIVSCAPKNIQGTLDTVEACIESCPDSAKTLLESVKLPFLATRELKARHALLHTIALDKNYIDLTTDSIIAPAVRHYTRRGTPDARFKTLYYLGRIRQNAGDNDAALDCFIKASAFASEETDTLSLARCYSAQGLLYSDSYDYEHAIEANRKAAELFLAAGNVNSYVNNILKIADCYWNLGSFDKTMDYVELVGSYKKSLSVRVLSTYYSVKLKVEIELKEDFPSTLDEYLKYVSPQYINWIIVSSAYRNLNLYAEAENAISNYSLYNHSAENDKNYYASMTQLYESMGNYEESVRFYKSFLDAVDSTYRETHKRNIDSIKLRHEKDMIILTVKNRNLILALVLTVVVGFLVVSVLFTRKYIKESKSLNELYLVAEKEKRHLESMLESSMVIDSEIRSILSDRIELLNEIALSHRLHRSEKASRSRAKMDALLNDTKEYLSTIGMTYVVKNPEIISFLKTKGLTTWEIGYCCLYIMGYNAKEISGIMNNNQVYKISSRIREKLGLEGGKVRLETYRKTLFAQG